MTLRLEHWCINSRHHGQSVPSSLSSRNLPLIAHPIIRERELDRDLTGRDIEPPREPYRLQGCCQISSWINRLWGNLRAGPIINTSARVSTAIRVLLNDVEVIGGIWRSAIEVAGWA